MKNKLKKILFILFINLVISSHLIAEEINFEANSIELIDKDRRIIAKKNIKIFNEKEIIYADEMDYDKVDQIIKAKGNIRIENSEQNIKIFSDELIYFKNQERIILSKNVKINYFEKLSFNTNEIVYDRNKKQIIVDDFSNFEDNFGNKISSAKSKFLLNERLLKINSVKMIDEINNNYFFKNALINFENNEIIADGIKIDFSKNSFGDENNDPRLRGNYLFGNNNQSIIKKGVFTTCKIYFLSN